MSTHVSDAAYGSEFDAYVAEMRRVFAAQIADHVALGDKIRRDAAAGLSHKPVDPTLDYEADYIERYWAAGVRAADVAVVEALGMWAMEHQTAVARPVNDGLLQNLAGLGWDVTALPEPTSSSVAQTLLSHWVYLSEPLPRLDVHALPWLGAAAGAPDNRAYRAVQEIATLLDEHLDIYLAWRRIGPAGPVAFAAGLPLAEAQERDRRGTLDVEALAVLAGLRGWRFPPL